MKEAQKNQSTSPMNRREFDAHKNIKKAIKMRKCTRCKITTPFDTKKTRWMTFTEITLY